MLCYHMPAFGLEAGDRLEPSTQVIDIASFERITPPFQCHFWRGNKNDRVMHETPLLAIPGVGLRTYCIDLLHSWHLGPLSDCIAHCIWYFLECGFYSGDLPWLGIEQKKQLGLIYMRNRLMLHYRERANAGDEEFKTKGSRIWSLTLKMIGKASNPLECE